MDWRDKHHVLFTETDLRAGKFEKVIEMLDSGEELPARILKTLSDMLKTGTIEETNTDFQLVIRSRDGKRGAPPKTLEEETENILLGRRVIELYDGPGNYEAATLQAASEYGVSARTAKSAYSFVKKQHKEIAEGKIRQAEIKKLQEKIADLEAKTNTTGLLNYQDADK